MKLPQIGSEERRWLASRLRAHAGCALGIAVLCGVIRAEPSHCIVPESPAPVIETAYDGERVIKTVMPSGWRRTKDGWEHVSSWAHLLPQKPTSINELIADQHDREPKWLRQTMKRVGQIPPLMIAVIQVTAIAAITFVAESKRRKV